MQPSLFLSYSRREVPFVNSLQGKLEKLGYDVWLDYRNLVPGKPWLGQLLSAISATDIFLLVVSKASIRSQNVDTEWQEAIACNKRIILIIFEAVALPEALKQYEWIDFRNNFRDAIEALTTHIENSTKQRKAPPEAGFKAPKIVWKTFCISILLSLCSLATFWTVYIPYHLLPLPYKILKRNFDFSNVQAATLMLPITLFWSLMLFIDLENTQHEWAINFVGIAFFSSIFIAPLLLIFLRLPGMQRWGKPLASRPKFLKKYKPKMEELQPVTFTIDAASEDKGYTRTLVRQLERHGHQYTASDDDADVGIVLLSAFKQESYLDPEKQVVYTVILQESDIIDVDLRQIQWIDFRRGIGNINAFSLLLSQPEKMGKALGSVPLNRQTVLPTAVQGIRYYLMLLCIFELGSALTLFLQSLQASTTNIGLLIILTAVFIAVALSLYRGLATR